MDLSVPADVGAEEGVLGSLILDRDGVITVAPFLQPAHFWDERHQRIYSAILALYARREPPDYSTLASELARRGDLAGIGGDAYLVRLMHNVATAVHVEYYGRNVWRAWLCREVIRIGGQIAGIGYTQQAQDPEWLLSEVDRLAGQLRNATPDGWSALPAVAMDVIADIEARAGAPGPSGLTTGLPGLDALTYGWEPGDLILLAARTSKGKTTLGLAFALAAAQTGKHVAVVSLEMRKAKLGRRFLVMESGVPMDRVRSARVTVGDWELLGKALAGLPPTIYLSDIPTVTVPALRAQVQKLQADPRRGCDLLVVDYLQLIGSAQSRDNRAAEVAAVSRGLKLLAEELGIPVIALSQFNRDAEDRAAPALRDLRESGALEQDASIVLALHQPDPNERARIDLHVLKNRDGEADLALALEWDGPAQRFIEVPAPALLRAGYWTARQRWRRYAT